MASYMHDELDDALEQYRRGELSFEEYKRMCDEEDREQEEENRRRAARKRGSRLSASRSPSTARV